MENSNRRRTFVKWLVWILRVAIGMVFLTSGFVKGVDVWGVIYKIEDYLTAFGWDWALPFVGFVAVVLPICEFVLGFLLAIGSFRRFSVALLLLGMLFFLPLTAYVALFDPVADCGCFGDAFTISNAATFWKNMAVTVGLCFLLVKNKTVRSLYGPAVQWLTILFPSVYLLLIILIGYYVQPLIDFRPYKIGTYLTSGKGQETDENYVFVYQKGNIFRNFTLDDLPDSTWNFVDRKALVKPAVKIDNSKEVNQIVIFDGDYDVTDGVLPAEGEVLLLLIPDIKDVNAATTFQINEMYDYATESGVSLVCLTGGTFEDVENWREFSMADYPIFQMDDSTMKTIARGNPAMVRISDGMILWKSTMQYVEIGDLATNLPNEAIGQNGLEVVLSLSVALLIVSMLLFLINRSPMIIKFGQRLRKNQNKGVNLPKNKTTI